MSKYKTRKEKKFKIIIRRLSSKYLKQSTIHFLENCKIKKILKYKKTFFFHTNTIRARLAEKCCTEKENKTESNDAFGWQKERSFSFPSNEYRFLLFRCNDSI